MKVGIARIATTVLVSGGIGMATSSLGAGTACGDGDSHCGHDSHRGRVAPSARSAKSST